MLIVQHAAGCDCRKHNTLTTITTSRYTVLAQTSPLSLPGSTAVQSANDEQTTIRNVSLMIVKSILVLLSSIWL